MSFTARFNGKQSIMLRLVVEDNAGLTAESTGMLVACLYCPDGRPSVWFIEPSEDMYKIGIGQDTIEIPVTVGYSDDNAVKKIELYINDISFFSMNLDSKSGTIDISPGATSIRLPRGNYTLKAVVKDSCNQTAEATKDIEVKKVEKKADLIWAYNRFGDPANYKDEGDIVACMDNNLISFGKLRYTYLSGPSAPSPTLYEGWLDPKSNRGPCTLSGYEYTMNIGTYDEIENSILIAAFCGTSSQPIAIWNIGNIDYSYKFPGGCTRIECKGSTCVTVS